MDLLKKLQLEMAIKEGRNMLPEFIQLASLVSEKMKIYYDGLIEAGFTEEQATEIICEHGIDAGRISWINTNGGEEERKDMKGPLK